MIIFKAIPKLKIQLKYLTHLITNSWGKSSYIPLTIKNCKKIYKIFKTTIPQNPENSTLSSRHNSTPGEYIFFKMALDL